MLDLVGQRKWVALLECLHSSVAVPEGEFICLKWRCVAGSTLLAFLFHLVSNIESQRSVQPF